MTSFGSFPVFYNLSPTILSVFSGLVVHLGDYLHYVFENLRGVSANPKWIWPFPVAPTGSYENRRKKNERFSEKTSFTPQNGWFLKIIVIKFSIEKNDISPLKHQKCYVC